MADLPVPVTSPEEVRRIADDVLRRPEFAEAQPTWWQRFVQEVYDAIARLVAAMSGDGRGSVIATVTIIAVGLALLYLVVRYTRTLRVDPAAPPVTLESLGRSPGEWLADAQSHEAAGRWRDAVRCRYRALLAELAANGLVEEVAGRTAGEYLAAVTADVPAAAAPFTDATRSFERAWYGHARVGRDEVEAFSAAASATSAAARRRRVAVATP